MHIHPYAQNKRSNPTLVVVVALLCSAQVLAQEVQLYVSSQAGYRLTAKPTVRFTAGAPEPHALRFGINDRVTYQKIAGFGASFMEAGLMVINSLPPQQQEEVLRAMFDPQQGAGFSAMKTPIASTDFMSAGPFYSYDPVPRDLDMKHFSIARDLGPNGVITYIKRARKHGNFVLQAPMDYPPDWMLFNPDTNQDVNPKYYDALAHYYLRYLQEYQKNGVFIDYLSLFNEPGVYTKIPYGEIRILLRDHVGPLLEKSGLKTRLMLSEAGDRDDAFTNYPLLMDDPEARKYVAVMPYHGYDFKEYSKMAELHRRYIEAPLWMTEVCYAYQAGTPKTLSLPVYDFADGDFWGQQIFSDLENYASAWIYWNAVLDEKGGPWAVSYIHGNPDPNIQHPVIIINRQTHKVTYTGLYYYLAHLSRFVRPGAVRIETTGNYPGVRVISFKTPEGKIVSELMNSRKEDAEVAMVANGHTLPLKLPAMSITTAVW
jgi:glucosylceramidase